jgi:AraC-like DNA-binding protein
MRIKDAVYVYRLVGGDRLAWHGRYHTHDTGEYEIHFFIEGAGAFLLNRSQYLIEGNRVFLTKPREFHSILPNAVRRPISYYAILFESDPTVEPDQEWSSLIRERFVSVDSRDRFLTEELYHLARSRGRKRAAEYLLLSLLYRWFGEGAEPEPIPREQNEHTERALGMMENMIREKLNIGNLAARLGISEEHFIRLFHKKLGMSPFQYFIRLKIEAAASFLVESSLKIGEVAERFGFENPFHFSRIFKKCTGLSPLEYRRNYSANTPPLTIAP